MSILIRCPQACDRRRTPGLGERVEGSDLDRVEAVLALCHRLCYRHGLRVHPGRRRRAGHEHRMAAVRQGDVGAAAGENRPLGRAAALGADLAGHHQVL
ncbi:hypothetical protein [Streptomyces olivochromogenes]|uniref:hypothetical protein n=1 Tax=Streptomyces olivochromogenes TaxID=1963 RepID=UPI00131C6B19|nr:hypothetical protein [Streptomyces olivochromogenes]